MRPLPAPTPASLHEVLRVAVTKVRLLYALAKLLPNPRQFKRGLQIVRRDLRHR